MSDARQRTVSFYVRVLMSSRERTNVRTYGERKRECFVLASFACVCVCVYTLLRRRTKTLTDDKMAEDAIMRAFRRYRARARPRNYSAQADVSREISSVKKLIRDTRPGCTRRNRSAGEFAFFPTLAADVGRAFPAVFANFLRTKTRTIPGVFI